jgi:hypothetical protein
MRTTRFHVEVHPRLCNELQEQVDSIEFIFLCMLLYSVIYILPYYEVECVYALTDHLKEKQKVFVPCYILRSLLWNFYPKFDEFVQLHMS